MNKLKGLKNYISLIVLLLCAFMVTSCSSREVTSSEEAVSSESFALTEETISSDKDNTSDKNNSLEEIASSGAASASEDVITYYSISFEGGTGKAYIESPVEVDIKGDDITACFVWSSENYDYMLVDGERYNNENEGGPSTFHVKVKNLDEPLKIIGDTTAMSKPHEIEYTVTWLEEVDGVAGNEFAGKEVTDSGESAGDGSEGAESELEEMESGKSDSEKLNLGESGFDPVEFRDCTLIREEELSYAECFRILDYDDFKLIQIKTSGNFVVLEEGAEEPEIISGEAVILRKPLNKTYLVSSSVMDFICELDALDSIRLSGTEADEWYIPEAAKAMEDGDIIYAGKYRAPDYERILSEGCNLAIENTMIYHNPEVKEKLEDLGIPVMIETSSYESHPLGRLEWIKVYGVLYDKESEAEAYYQSQLASVEPIMQKEKTELTVVFFYVTASGVINVRVPGDYISEMIELSGGNYIFPDSLGESDSDNGTMKSSVNVQVEDFYKTAKDADIIIYNSTIGGEIESLDDFLEKNELFKSFKAVEDNNVYCTEADFFQKTTGMSEFMEDLQAVFTKEERDFTYLRRLE